MSLILLTCIVAASPAEVTAVKSPVEIRLDVGDSSKVVRPGEEKHAVLLLRNTGDQPAKGTVHLHVESFDGDVAQESTNINLAASGELRVPLPKQTFHRLGIKWVRYHWEEDGKSTATAEAAFAYMAPTGPGARGTDGFVFAIAFGAGPDNLSDEAIRRSSLCGAIKEGDPSSRVTTGGFASLDHHGRKPGMAERVIEECQDSYDLIANHKHGEFGGFVEEFEYRLAPLCVRVLKQPKPFYLTETGMDNRWGEMPQQHYRISLPDNAFGSSDAAFRDGVRINLRVHDNDGQGQKGWLQLAPGQTPEDATGWPLLLLR